MRFLLPDDWRSPETPGDNELRWAVHAAGTVTFTQVDDWAIEGSFAAPWVHQG